MTIRLLTPLDIPAAMELVHAAGWNQTVDDWLMLLALAPEGCFGIECDGRVVATTTVVEYGTRLGWIGMVLTDERYQRKGYASALLNHAVQFADTCSIHTLKLDATEEGQPLYERVGFVIEQPIERFARPGSSPNIETCEESIPLDLDQLAFGASRAPLLTRLAQRSRAVQNHSSYVLARSGSRAAYLGPCIADSVKTARTLINDVIQSSGNAALYWDLLPQNRYAIMTAQESGFVRQRSLVRMRRGPELQTEDHLTYAIAGFELG